jgi:hypothetical protein
MWRKYLLGICLIVSGWRTPSIAQDANVPQPPASVQPLSPEELRETLVNLLEGLADGERVIALNEFIKMQRELMDRERESLQRQIELEKELRGVVEKERNAERARGDQLDKLLSEALKKRGGFGCAMKKLFTIGIARC